MPLAAQITTTLNRPAGRAPEIEIRNDSSALLTAFALRMAPNAGEDREPFLVFRDAAVDGTDPLAQGQKFTVPLPVRFRPGGPREDLYEVPVSGAAVFAGGETTGDAALLSRLLLRRSTMLQSVDLTIDILSDAGSRNVPRRQLIDQFQKLADSVNHWYLPAEQQVGRSLYQSIVSKLMSLPEPKLGAPFPPNTFAREEMLQLNRQRTTLLESQPAISAESIRR